MKSIKSRFNRAFIQMPQLSYALSNNDIFYFFILYVKLFYFSSTRMYFLKNHPMEFTFKYANRTFVLTLVENLDISVLVEIFVLKEYAWRPSHELNSILDLGAHWGDTAVYYALTYPQAKILSVEPMPSTFNRLVTETNQFKNISVLQAALSTETGEATLYFSDNSIGNSLSKRSQSTNSIVVPTVSMRDLLAKVHNKKFDLVKFDVEGAETVIFEYAKKNEFSRSYIGEIHLDLIPCNLNDIRASFEGYDVEFKQLKKNRYILTAIEQKKDH